VWQGVSGGTVFPAITGPILQGPHHLGVIQQSTGTSNLITEIQKAVTTDSYLSGVLQSVLDSDDNFFRDFYLDVRETLCYQRMEDTRPGYVYLPCAKRQFSVLLMGTVHSLVILALTKQQPLCHTQSIGQVCTPMWHISCAHAKCVLHQKVLSINVWGQRLIPQSLYNQLQAGPWI